jgi:hypothetical protein
MYGPAASVTERKAVRGGTIEPLRRGRRRLDAIAVS